MIRDITDVERPAYPKRLNGHSLKGRLLETLTTWRAIRVSLGDASYGVMRNKIGCSLAKTGYSVRTSRPTDGSDSIIAWAIERAG